MESFKAIFIIKNVHHNKQGNLFSNIFPQIVK